MARSAGWLASKMVPEGPPPSPEALQKIMRDVYAVRQEMKAAGAWVFAAGLHAPSTATVVRVKDGDVVTTDGPFVEGKEHIGGLSIVKAIIERPSRIATRLGVFAATINALAPKMYEVVMNTAFELFPDSAAGKQQRVPAA